MSNNIIDLITQIEKTGQCSEINLSNVTMNSSIAQRLITAVSNCNIESLIIDQTVITDEDVTSVQYIRKHAVTRMLNNECDSKRIITQDSNEWITRLLSAASNNKTLKSLIVKYNYISMEAGAIIADIILSNTLQTFELLYVIQNNVMMQIMQSISNCTSLESIKLVNCYLDSNFTNLIVDGIKSNRNLHVLNISENIFNDSLLEIVKALSFNESIRFFDASQTLSVENQNICCQCIEHIIKSDLSLVECTITNKTFGLCVDGDNIGLISANIESNDYLLKNILQDELQCGIIKNRLEWENRRFKSTKKAII